MNENVHLPYLVTIEEITEVVLKAVLATYIRF
jgi:hypothetical protein